MVSKLITYILITALAGSTVFISGIFFPLDYKLFEGRDHIFPLSIPCLEWRLALKHLWHKIQMPRDEERNGEWSVFLQEDLQEPSMG